MGALCRPGLLAKFDNTVIGLFKNELGQSMIAKLNGYTPDQISTPDLDAILGSYASVSDATGYSYMLGGHQMYVISFQARAIRGCTTAARLFSTNSSRPTSRGIAANSRSSS